MNLNDVLVYPCHSLIPLNICVCVYLFTETVVSDHVQSLVTLIIRLCCVVVGVGTLPPDDLLLQGGHLPAAKNGMSSAIILSKAFDFDFLKPSE